MLDETVAWLGLYVESKTSEIDKDGKRKWTIQQVLNGEGERRMGTMSEIFAMSDAEVMDN